MDPRRRSLKIIILVLFLGAVIGTVLGDLLAFLLPPGVVRDFFLLSFDSARYGLASPITLDMRLFTITFGFTVHVNFTGLVGIGVAYYLLRYYRV